MRKIVGMAIAAGLLAWPLLCHAQAVQALDGPDSGDTAWLLAASALVLFMALPGLALFYGGQVRAKSALAVPLQIGAIAAVSSLLWIIVGYTVAFGPVTASAMGGWIGGGSAWMLLVLGNVREGTLVPESAFVLFQMAFAVLTPALMVGAWADRARLGWVAGFAALWSLIVYAPITHWVWGGGWLATQMGTLDYAGGIVVHTAAGVSALTAALLIGKRGGFPDTPMPPHAPMHALVGAAMLWVGWFGLNGGSALAATDDAATAIINTHAAACAAALAWLLIETVTTGKPSAVGFAKGAVAGLVMVSPAAGYIAPGAAILMGLIAAILAYALIQIVRLRLAVDDSLDVFAVHGACGMAGALMVGVFLDPALGGAGYAEGMGLARQLFAQAAGVAVVAAWSAIGTVIAALAVSMVIPMRVTEEEELAGLG